MSLEMSSVVEGGDFFSRMIGRNFFFFSFVRLFFFYFILFYFSTRNSRTNFHPIEIHRWGIVSRVLVEFSYQILRDHSRKELIIVIIKKNYRDFESVFGVN